MESNNQTKLAAYCLKLYAELKKSHVDGPWSPSPVEERGFDLREFFLNKKGILDKFRRTFLVAGRQNFPDSPRGEFYIHWGLPGDIPMQLRIQGKIKIFQMILKLFFYSKFQLKLSNLKDTMIGKPVPQKILGYDITESQIRNFYYKEEIKKNIGEDHNIAVEIGGGFGGLAGELLTKLKINQYILVELFDAIPLAYYYLRNLLDDDIKIQVITEDDSVIDNDAKVILMAPNQMSKISSDVTTFINTMSFQHMNEDAIKFYLNHADRLNAKNIFLNNRDWVRDPSDLIISQYPIPKNYKNVVWKKWLYGDHTLAVYKRT